MVRKPDARMCGLGSRTKCTDVWTGLRTCAVPSANGLHTIRQEPKFVCVGTPRELDAPSVLCSSQVRRKFINRAPNTRRTRTAQHVSGAHVYTRFKMGPFARQKRSTYRMASSIVEA